MSGVRIKTYIRYQIDIGDDGKPVSSPTVIRPLIIPRINLALINLLKDVRPIADEQSITQKVLQ